MAILDASTVFNNSLDYAISLYMQLDENKDELLKKFNSDKVALVQWLRERAFNEPVKDPALKALLEIKNEAPLLNKRTNKKKAIPDDKNQSSIF